jgi:hypothetical protein
MAAATEALKTFFIARKIFKHKNFSVDGRATMHYNVVMLLCETR